jgi:hypothetical protein
MDAKSTVSACRRRVSKTVSRISLAEVDFATQIGSTVARRFPHRVSVFILIRLRPERKRGNLRRSESRTVFPQFSNDRRALESDLGLNN